MRSEFKLAKETSERQNFLKSAADSFFNFLHTSFSEKLEGLFQIDDKPSRFSVVLTVFNQFDKLSGRDVMSMNAFLTKVLSSNCVILCQNFITRRMLLNVEGMAPKSPYTAKVEVFRFKPRISFENFNLGFSVVEFKKYLQRRLDRRILIDRRIAMNPHMKPDETQAISLSGNFS